MVVDGLGAVEFQVSIAEEVSVLSLLSFYLHNSGKRHFGDRDILEAAQKGRLSLRSFLEKSLLQLSSQQGFLSKRAPCRVLSGRLAEQSWKQQKEDRVVRGDEAEERASFPGRHSEDALTEVLRCLEAADASLCKASLLKVSRLEMRWTKNARQGKAVCKRRSFHSRFKLTSTETSARFR